MRKYEWLTAITYAYIVHRTLLFVKAFLQKNRKYTRDMRKNSEQRRKRKKTRLKKYFKRVENMLFTFNLR